MQLPFIHLTVFGLPLQLALNYLIFILNFYDLLLGDPPFFMEHSVLLLHLFELCLSLDHFILPLDV